MSNRIANAFKGLMDRSVSNADVAGDSDVVERLMDHGLFPFSMAHGNEGLVEDIASKRKLPIVEFGYREFEMMEKAYPNLVDYMFLSTGVSPVVVINFRTLEVFDFLAAVINATVQDGKGSETTLDVEKVGKWFDTEGERPSLEELARTDFKGFREHVDSAMAGVWGDPKLELVWSLVPWGAVPEKDRNECLMVMREKVLSIRQSIEYPSKCLDRDMVRVLRATKGRHTGIEKPVTGPMTLYRGERDKSTHFGMSWTTDPETARFFATRFGANSDSVVYRCEFPEKDILAVYGDDSGADEHEVLVDVRDKTALANAVAEDQGGEQC